MRTSNWFHLICHSERDILLRFGDFISFSLHRLLHFILLMPYIADIEPPYPSATLRERQSQFADSW